MQQSSITFDVLLDDGKVPEEISWNATGTTAEAVRKAKATAGTEPAFEPLFRRALELVR